MKNEIPFNPREVGAYSWTEYYLKQKQQHPEEDTFSQKTFIPSASPTNPTEQEELLFEFSDLKGKVCDELVESLFTLEELQKGISALASVSAVDPELNRLLKKFQKLRNSGIYK